MSALLLAALIALVGVMYGPVAPAPSDEPPPGRLRGILLPIIATAEVRVYVFQRDDLVLVTRAFPDAKDGSYTVEGLPPGKYVAEMSAPWRVAEDRDVELAPGQTADLGTVVLEEAGAISGRIAPARARSSRGAAGALILALRREDTHRLADFGAWADKRTGRYLIKGMRAGTYDLTIEAEGFRKVVGIRNLVTAPGELSASDVEAIRDLFLADTEAWKAHDYAGRLRHYSESFRNKSGLDIAKLRSSFRDREGIKRTKGPRALGNATHSLVIRRIFPGRGQAAVICYVVNGRVNPETGRHLWSRELYQLWGLRKEGHTWRFTYQELIGSGTDRPSSFTTDPRVSGIRVLPGKLSAGHDWELAPIQQAG
jgi:hypothetical protein